MFQLVEISWMIIFVFDVVVSCSDSLELMLIAHKRFLDLSDIVWHPAGSLSIYSKDNFAYVQI